MKRICTVALSILFAIPAAVAQAPAAATAPTNPLSSAIKRMFDGVKINIVEAADKMPEASYSFKPTPEVRSFGEIVGHLANANFLFCSQAKGEKNPATENFEQKTSKADLTKGLKDSVAYCDGVYGSLTDASGMEMVKTGNSEAPRSAPLIRNMAHDNEHYGNLVTYLRLKNIVPPSTERAQQAQQQRPASR
jgi:uncharacterized damage-inducible protein DinB